MEADDLLDEPDPTAPPKAAPKASAPGRASQPASPKSAATKAVQQRSLRTNRRHRSRLVESRSVESRFVESRLVEGRPVESRFVQDASPKTGSSRHLARRPPLRSPAARVAPLHADAVTLQLARLVDDPPEGDEWLHEPKWDGYRILALIKRGEVSLWSRNRLQWTQKIPAIATALGSLGLREAALDGELIAGHGSQKDFGLLQATLSGEKRGALSYMLFDILHLDGVDLAGVPLSAQEGPARADPEEGAAPRLIYSSHIVGHGKAVFKEATAQGLEGIISKRADAPHQDGRSDDWRKIKEADERRIRGGGIHAAQGREDRLRRAAAGAAGSGTRLALHRPARYRLLPRASSPNCCSRSTATRRRRRRCYVPPHDTDLRGARWIEPSVVVEAFYRGVGKEGLLRQPSLKTVRTDKRVEDLLDSDRDEPPPAAARIGPTERAAKPSRRAGKPADGRPRRPNRRRTGR